MIAELLGVGGAELSDLRFFQPRPEFLAAMECFRGLQLYDVGAGVGHVSAALAARAHEILAPDINRRERTEHEVWHANGATYPYEAGSVVLLCRPCHGPFPSYVVKQALARQVRAVVYVGFPKNRRADLGQHSRRFRTAMLDVGEDGERMYLLDLREGT